MSQNTGPSVPSSLTPIRCTTEGTSIVPLEPLARHLEAWLVLPSPSRWLTRTIRLGYAIQLGKEQALPCAENLFSWCGVRLGEYYGAPHGRARPISAELTEFLQRQDCGSVETVSEAPMASAAAVTPLGLLHMRPLQHWLHSRVPRWAWRCGALQVNITQECRHSFSPWTDLAFLRAGVPLEQVTRHVVVTTDASSTG